jgi:asparagine synthase (glutamine-hydrolysing)
MLGLTSQEASVVLQDGPLLPEEHTAGMTDIETMMATDMLYYLPDDILTKVDRASMAHALEVRSPFMDYRLVEFAARLPVAHKLRGLTTKYILRKAFERDLPDEPIKRAKHGFATPIGDEFLGPLQNTYRETVLGSRSDTMVDRTVAEEMLTGHLSGRVDNSHKLWLLLFLHAWADWWKRDGDG